MNEIVGDELGLEMIKSMKNTMGMKLNDMDMININNFTIRIIKLINSRKQLNN